MKNIRHILSITLALIAALALPVLAIWAQAWIGYLRRDRAVHSEE